MPGSQSGLVTMDEKDDENHISMKLVKMPIFMGSDVEFQISWFQFHAFSTMGKFVGPVKMQPEVHLPVSKSASLVMNAKLWDKQKAVKKHYVITFSNLTTALDSPCLIGMLMRAQTTNWPSGLASMVVNQLFDKFKPHDMVLLIDMNQLKQCIGLQPPQSNPQTMFDHIASLENQFKPTMSDHEMIAIAIEKLPAEYQPVLTAEMRKEGSLLTAAHQKSCLSVLAGSTWFVCSILSH